MKRLIAACALLLAAVTAHAQVDRATLSGAVKDASGAVIQGATVTVTLVATNGATRVKANSEGNYLAFNLVPGTYRVEAEAQGFQKASQTVILETGQRGSP